MIDYFVIFTPYQLISSINIIAQYKLKEFKMILVHPNLEKYINALEKKFGNVYFLPSIYDTLTYKSKLLSRIRIVLDINRKKKIIKKQDFIRRSVRRLFVPSDDIICRVIYKELMHRNRNLELSLYDDGVGTYVGKIDKKKNVLAQFVYTVFLTGKFYEMVKSVYCYRPELMKLSKSNVKLEEITLNSKNLDLFKKLVEEHKSNYMGKKVIFFDQGFSEMYIEECLEILKRYFNSQEIVVKKHPRLDSNMKYHEFVVSNDGLPAEFIFSSFNCENCILISHSSTANVTPYLLYGKKITTIMLFNMDGNGKKKYDEILCYIDRINEVIGEDYIKLPNNKKEFEVCISNIINSISGIREWEE